ncbi:TonB-dependent siderophore receptor [Acinetobacter puyangensis]|uniref:Outer-membrane receptor for ferric coprogen and ferric-rhodotorulic acid n=1 Tax=Acinetobacter puyangensis TaxID=1096779 RepID=A0A240EAQ4_9GAMM|nr:TonB-dependent receptor [Acinetobacter puyangensis]SNX44980.1 outer-membrane receptor for ferric coprogen and ferric-rhodotorulic acid [Acinetobacter puyangensis]
MGIQKTALSLVMATLLYSTSVYAQNVELNLPAQPLSQSVQQLARQANVDIIYIGDILNNKTAPKVQGNLSVQQALHQLLQGTNLVVEKKGSVWSIVEGTRSSSQGELREVTNSIQLPVIVVKAIDDDPREDSKNNYGVNRSSSTTKLDLALKDTPQSITIITQKQIEEQALTDVNKILEATPGVTVQNYGVPGAGRATFYSRGYEINNVMVDGAPTLISGTRGMELLAGMDTVIYDRVEVTRGSTGLSTGTGDPSASINFVRKRPGFEAERSGKISWGIWGKKRVELDVSQPFTSDGSIRGRFVGAYAQGGTYIDRIQEETKTLYGIVEADLGEKTTVAVGGTWFDKDIDDASPHMTAIYSTTYNTYKSGLFDSGSRKWNAATDWSYAHTRMWNGFLTLDHAFNDHWKLSTNYQYTRSMPDRVWGILGSEWYNATDNTASISIGRENDDSKIHNLDISLLGKFELFGREAQIALGANGFNQKTFSPNYYTSSWSNSPSCSTSIHAICTTLEDWNGHIAYPENSGRTALKYGQYPLDKMISHNDIHEKQYGYFFSTKFEPIDKLKVILGTRFNHYEIKNNFYNVSKIKEELNSYEYSPKDKWIPYAGLIYDLTPNTTAYASYTGIYKTQLEKDKNDNFLPFIEGNSYEIGVKGALMDNKLNLATAIFRMKEENIAYLDSSPTSGTFTCTPVTGTSCEIMYASDGPTISGFEISAQGQLTPKWLINAGYTFLHVKSQNGYERISGSSMTTGDYSYERPKHAINLSTSYLATDKLTVGGSIRWKYKTTQGISYCTDTGYCSDTTTSANQIARSQGGFAVVDLMARYQINEYINLGLNITNLFDKEYRSNDLGSVYGIPRSGTISLGFKF